MEVSADPSAGSLTTGSLTRGEARERAILDAALELLSTVGYDRMSMDGLAAHARASKATIYRRWPSKAQVVVDALRRRSCPAQVTPPDSGSLREDLLQLTRCWGAAISGEDAPLFVSLMVAARCDDELAAVLDEQVHDEKDRIALAVVERAIARGELEEGADATLLREVLTALVFTRVLVLRLPIDDCYLVHLVDEILLPVLGAHAAFANSIAS